MTMLTGSQKQISWAARIRENFIADGEETKREIAAFASEAPALIARQVAGVDRAIAAAKRNGSARFWIDNYGRRTGDSWGRTALALEVRR